MRRPRSFSALAVALIAAIYFTITCAHTLQPFDSSEFVLTAVQFGVAPPPGQPLYLLLSALAVRVLPFAPPFVLSLLSVVITAALAALSLRFVLWRGEA